MSPTATTVRITLARRLEGPLAAATGGYACGLVARFVDGPAAVRLHRPVPPDTPLDAERHADGSVTLHHDGVLLAEGEPALPLDFEPPRSGPALTTLQPFAGADGPIAPETAWAALASPLPHEGLVSMTAELLEPARLDSSVVAVGWSLGGDGRASALVSADGRLLARAQALRA